MSDCKRFFADNFDAFKDDLKGLIEIPSVTSDKETSVKALDYVIGLARESGLKAFTAAGGRVGVVEYGEGGEAFGILVHVDVVEAEASEWRFPPFALTESEGRLYGRGVVDDKGAVMIILYMLKYLRKAGIRGNRKIQLIIGTQEESEWDDIDAYKVEMSTPCCGFTPDGDFPISNAEKGYIDLELSFPAKAVTAVKGGNAPNTVPSLISVTVENREYIFKGKAAHSSSPWSGVNAIIKAASELEGVAREEAFRFLRENFDDNFYGDREGTVVCPSLISLDDGMINLTLNVRTAPGASNAEVIAYFEEKGREYGFSLSSRPYAMEPIHVDRESGFIKLMKKTYDRIMDTDSDITLGYGTSYAKALPNFVSFGPLLPGEPDTFHQADENMSVSNIHLAFQIYAEYMEELCSMR